MWDNVDRYSSEGRLFLGLCPRNVFPKNEWANIRDSFWSFKDHCLEVEKAKDDLELNSVELPVLSFTNLSPTTSLSAPLSTKEQVTCWKSLSSPNHQHSSRNHLHLEEQGAVFQLTIETSTDPDPPLVIVLPPPPPPEIVVELLVIVISPPPPPPSRTISMVRPPEVLDLTSCPPLPPPSLITSMLRPPPPWPSITNSIVFTVLVVVISISTSSWKSDPMSPSLGWKLSL